MCTFLRLPKTKHCIIFLLLLVSTLKHSAQIAGSFTVPGSFPTIAAAINTLNILGVAGPVTINVTAGYTELAPNGGYQLFNPVGGSSTNQVLFRKLGTGANPLITAYTGTATPASTIVDGVWWLIGADYITIDGIDIVDPNTTNPATMEFGYGFYKLNTNDGCQNNTIKNCVISMNRINGVSSGNVNFIASGSRGIDLSCTIYTLNQSVQSSSSPPGSNSYNKFYSNYINNCHTGISMMGATASANDLLNDVGGVSAVTGNTIVNFGGASGAETYGVRTNSQYFTNISYNVINNNDGGGSGPLSSLTAIRIGTATASSISANNNTITLSSPLVGSTLIRGIQNFAGDNSSSSTNTVDINNNVFPSYKYPGSSSLMIQFISSVASARRVNINNNFIDSVFLASSVSNFISTSGGATLSVNSNTITNVINTGLTISSNQIYLINAQATLFDVSNNFLRNVSGYDIYGIYGAINLSSANTSTIANNSISNITAYLSTGIFCQGTGFCNITDNEVMNFSSPANVANGMVFTGILVNNTVNNIRANTIYSVTSTGTSVTSSNLGHMTGIAFSANNSSIAQNKIYSMETNGTGTLQAIRVSGSNATVVNNVVGDLRSSRSNQQQAIVGIMNINSSARVAFNSIVINNTVNTGANAGSSVIWQNSSSASFTLNNNIFVNTSVATGAGSTKIIGSNINLSTWYATVSNRNLFYIGTPQNNRFIATIGTSSYSTLSALKMGLTPREAQSVTEDPPFLTTDGSLPNTLSIDPLIATQIESGAAPFLGVTGDYINTLRNASTPDIGAWEGNFKQADIFAPTIVSQGFIEKACNLLTGRTLTVHIKDTSGVATGTLAPRVYYRVNFALYSSIPGTLTAGTATNGVWTFSINYSASINDVVSYFIVAQDASFLSNFTIMPSAAAVADNVNSVAIPPNPAFTYTIESNPTISVNNGIMCAGKSYILSPSGAASFSYSGGSQIVTPSTTTSYTITGSSAGGCPAVNTVVCTVSVMPTPTITVNSGSICVGQNFTLMPTGATSYTYLNGGPLVSPTSFGAYYVVGSNIFGCVSNTAAAAVTAHTGSIQANVSKSTICFGEEVLFSVSNAATHSWNNGVISNVPYYPNASGSYIVSGTGLNGCSANAMIFITVNPAPALSVSADKDTICEGYAVTLTASGASSYTWSVKNFTTPVIEVILKVSSIFTVSSINNFGCSSTKTIETYVDPCVGIQSFGLEKVLEIFPNPNSGEFSIKINAPKNNLQVKILNAVSQLVYEAYLEEEATLIDTGLPSGIYYVLLIKNGELLLQKKLMVTR